MQIGRDRYSLSVLGGSILVVSGFSIWWYAQCVVLDLQQLVNASTTQEELWRYYGSLQWWRLQQTSLLNPLATILTAIGIFLIGTAGFWLARRANTTRIKEGS